MTSNRWSDLDRPPLDANALRRALVTPGSLWTSLDVVEQTGSTNSDLIARARTGAAEGAVLVAEEQTAGRGRLDRRWSAPPRSGLFFSILLRPDTVPEERWGWLPLLVGTATAAAVAGTAGVDTALKWPNDLLLRAGEQVRERKAAGILAERVGGGGVERGAGAGGVVIGVGLNVSLREDELPTPQAGSLALAGAAVTDRDPLLRAVLRSIAEWYVRWRDLGGDPHASGVFEAYTAGCATLGRRVRVEMPGGEEVLGQAEAVDEAGRLVVRDAEGVRREVAAGDIVHLR